jgi:Cu+-exporting ATPase
MGSIRQDEIENILFHIEQHSSHPIAKSIVKELSEKIIAPNPLSNIIELKGMGMQAQDQEGNVYKVGTRKMIRKPLPESIHSLYVFKNDALVAQVDIEDEIKEQANEMIDFLLSKNIEPVLLSGDTKATCEALAKKLGIQKVYSEQSPEEKLQVLQMLLKEGKVGMVGDGINDAPALAQSSVGISIANATQVAIQSSQIILLNKKDLFQLKMAYLLSQHTLRTIKQNLFWAFFYNVVAIPIAATGFLSPIVGALTMAFSDVVVIGNSIRLNYKKLI